MNAHNFYNGTSGNNAKEYGGYGDTARKTFSSAGRASSDSPNPDNYLLSHVLQIMNMIFKWCTYSVLLV
jgi:hypothetical protein